MPTYRVPKALPSLVFLALLALFAPATNAQSRDALQRSAEAALQRNAELLRQRSPPAAELLREAVREARQNHASSALAAAERASSLVPDSGILERLRCGILLTQRRRDAALSLCRLALRHDASAASEAALARVLAENGSPDELAEGLSLVRHALQSEPAQPDVLLVAAELAARSEDLGMLREVLGVLERVLPGDEVTLRVRMVERLQSGHLEEGERIAAQLYARGALEPARYAELRGMIDAARPWPVRLWRRWLAPYVAAWFASLLALVLAGALLRPLTLRASRGAAVASPGTAERAVRACYRLLGALCAWFFYASLPMVVLGTLAVVYLGLRVLGLFDVLPVRLLLLALAFLALVLFGTLYALVRALWRGGEEADPGVPLELAGQPRFAAALEEVARRVGAPPIDAVYLTPDTTIGVFEQGSLGQQLLGRTRRCLLLGAGLLGGLDVQSFEAILAHECGHLRNEDTAGGRLVFAVRRALQRLSGALGEARLFGPWSPAWWFVVGYLRLYLWIVGGASRLQEVLADRWAAASYGSAAAVRGLRASVREASRFAAQADQLLKRAIEQKEYVLNLYALAGAEAVDEAALAERIERELALPPHWADSHPPISERVATLEALAVTVPEEDLSPAWGLFDAPEALQAAVTAWLRASLARRGRRVWAETEEEAAQALADRKAREEEDAKTQEPEEGEGKEESTPSGV